MEYNTLSWWGGFFFSFHPKQRGGGVIHAVTEHIFLAERYNHLLTIFTHR